MERSWLFRSAKQCLGFLSLALGLALSTACGNALNQPNSSASVTQSQRIGGALPSLSGRAPSAHASNALLNGSGRTGDLVENSLIGVRVSGVKEPATGRESGPFPASRGRHWAVVDVSLTNRQSKTVSFSPVTCISATDSGGADLTPSLLAGGGKLDAAPVAPGATQSGDVLFSVSAGQHVTEVYVSCVGTSADGGITIRVD